MCSWFGGSQRVLRVYLRPLENTGVRGRRVSSGQDQLCSILSQGSEADVGELQRKELGAQRTQSWNVREHRKSSLFRGTLTSTIKVQQE